jgi:hypothetical protein
MVRSCYAYPLGTPRRSLTPVLPGTDSGRGGGKSSKTQLCFNATIGQYYSIKQWSVQVEGTVEHEQIIAQSFQPNGDVLTLR